MRKKIVSVILLAVLLTAACTSALAIVRCSCGLTNCICFIQRGDKGRAVSGVIDHLFAQGYLPSSAGNTYTDEVEYAVMEFQRAHKLKADGKLNDNTLTWLLFGMSNRSMDKTYPYSDGQEVWVSTDGGTKYHSNPTCSRMQYARKMSARNAEALGFTLCSRCWE